MNFLSNLIYSINFIICICLISIQAQIIQPSCSFNDQCSCKYQDGAIVQLKYLGDYIEGYMTVKDSSGKSSDTYNFNPCKPFTVKDASPCENVVACQHQHLGIEYLYDIGTLTPPPQFSTSQKGDVVITYSDKTGYMRTSEVTCICDQSYTGKPGLTSQGELYTKFKFEMRHACCCKDVCKDGMTAGGGGSLSGGSILLILCFVLLAVYLLIGTLFMKYKKGAIGTEIVPNKDFWTDIPHLVKDGLTFVLSPCTKRSSYNQV